MVPTTELQPTPKGSNHFWAWRPVLFSCRKNSDNLPRVMNVKANDFLDCIWSYHERGLTMAPAKGKIAVGPWLELQTRRNTEDELLRWFKETRNNVAIITGSRSGVVVIDVDDLPAGRKVFSAHPTPLVSKTGRGVHLWYRHPGVEIGNRVKFLPGLDFRGDGGYVIAPASRHENGKPYEWIRYTDSLESIPVFDPAWLGEREKPSTVSSMSGVVRNGLSYIMNIRAVAGERGHDATFRAAVKLAESGMSEVEMLSAMVRWNQTNAEPPWTVQELTHKVTDAYKAVMQKMNQQLVMTDGCRDGSCDVGGRMRK